MEIFAIANLGRFKHIVTTLFKYGFDDIAERLNIPGKVFIKKVQSVGLDMTTWERVRRTLEELGPTFVKLGQILSQRPDLLPLELIQELEKLQDSVAPVAFTALKQELEASLDASVEDVFTNFSEEPLAAGSLAQVHRAILRSSGEVVAVKVRRPDVSKIIETDLHILQIVVPYLSEHFEFAQIYNLQELLKELRRSLLREINFSREARNMKIVAGNFSDYPQVFIPKVYDDYSSEKVLTMELAEGTKIKDFHDVGQDRRERLAKTGLNIIIKQILDDGFFHADPHPGNLLIMVDDHICLLDWGIVGVLPAETRYELVDLIDAIIEQNAEKALDRILSFTAVQDHQINETLLLRDILEMLYTYHSVPIGDLNMKNFFSDINMLLRTHGLRMPSDLALMLKAIVTAEGTAQKLYPELDVIAEIKPFILRLSMERWNPKTIFRKLSRQLRHLLEFQSGLPARLRSILDRIDAGELSIKFEHENLTGLRRTLDSLSNRLAFSILTSSLIIGSSMIITTGVKPLLFGYPAIGIIGYFISAILGMTVIINIIRSKKL